MIISHFTIAGERFTVWRGVSLAIAVTGAALSGIAPFRHAGESGATIGQMGVGFVLLLIGVLLFGFAAVYIKWKTPNTNVTVSGVMQLASSSVFCLIWSLCYDQPRSILSQISKADGMTYVWAGIVGCFGSGLGVHAFVYLIGSLGAPMANFVTIGQILVGVGIGVAALGEWNSYAWWEISLNVAGMVLLGLSIWIVFAGEKTDIPEPGSDEEDDKKEENMSHPLSEIVCEEHIPSEV
jgi:drug/metabolite transporter (DMT)-like permease